MTGLREYERDKDDRIFVSLYYAVNDIDCEQ